MEIIQNYLKSLRDSGFYPEKYTVNYKNGNLVEIENQFNQEQRKVLTFCTNDILGLTQSELVRRTAIEAIVEYGTSNSSCSVLSGRIHLHTLLEQEISSFKGLPHTQLFLNAWMAMQALMDSFCHLSMPIPGFEHTQETLILTDVLNHDCITAAIVNASHSSSGQFFSRSPKVKVKPYRHCNVDDLASKLHRYAHSHERIMVVSDAVFSMDGDIAPLPDMLAVLQNYEGSVLVLDEAHASGAIGATGRGIYEHFNIEPHQAVTLGIEPIIMTTFSKFAASAGAAISTRFPELIELLDISRPCAGTISLAPSLTAAALESFRQVRQNPQLVKTLQANTDYLRSRLLEFEFNVLGQTNIIPVVLPNNINPKIFAQHLMEDYGIWVSPIWFIAKPRLRIVVNALHTLEEMDTLVAAMIAVRDVLLQK
ncbi:pyridoxal phosphate-dependent aminotransferase family protein [Anabaena sp. UHCC 0399]|uniref:aminotransferase class I/II-fold pyridoxal phosphate-dependent enzyme n=1 Tax=Anabaena sp. UHCC 0399 TaxID=3110238 RepID=UPI002B20F745|nr:pyridoxal phosphate-dependent aminotransferase family protein [Anabaena sp. UHCC 0399]MEA5566626.1 pyridoxal phosphate-dependent aminotransferase family protein [Anabaena sp. UHCC 0399]